MKSATITRYRVAHRFGASYRYDSDYAIEAPRPDGTLVRLNIGGHRSLDALKQVLRRYGVTTFVLSWETK